MGFVPIAVAVSVLACINLSILRSFQSHKVGSTWWDVLIVAWVVGALGGVWGGFCFEYRPLNELRVVGALVPVMFFHWEKLGREEQWVDFLAPAPIIFAGSNVIILALLAACPVGPAFWLRRRVLAEPRELDRVS